MVLFQSPRDPPKRRHESLELFRQYRLRSVAESFRWAVVHVDHQSLLRKPTSSQKARHQSRHRQDKNTSIGVAHENPRPVGGKTTCTAQAVGGQAAAVIRRHIGLA